MRALVAMCVLGTLLLPATPAAAAATDDSSEGGFTDQIDGLAGVEDGTLSVDVEASVAGTNGKPAVAPPAPAAPEGVSIRVSALDDFADPPCITTSWVFLEGVDEATADQIERDRENRFIAEYEAYISGGTPPPPACPTPEGDPGLDPTPALEFADTISGQLPTADPSISGSYAITGLRSWLDLGRANDFRLEAQLDLGAFTRTATATATATTVVDWGDGTVTAHTSAGGGYHDGEPGPDDIVHTYVNAVESNAVTVTDTWDITVSVPGLDDITLTWTADPVTLTFPVREVRSTRDR